ncbi:CAP domain-containing protein [Chitinophaga sp. GCM10012297]|uniref:CAP domain-containing protein n=1 Tax=Chitinophaga chungangae TaxID=2821488 RepID=A0ABS3YEM1_9BACT|nr:CAP domain-containing protein [Chitinophaga chungangae]MBO9152905.1 CAP domain-containing protein [Chitinophaga chungangae]
MIVRFARPAIRIAVCVGLLACAACSKEPLTLYTPPPPEPIGDTTFVMNNPVNEALLLSLVNDVRAKGCQCGDTFMAPAPPIRWNKALERAAYLHSQDMDKNSYFSHNDLQGNNAGKRISRMGYFWQAWGENIALGKLTEKTVVEGWYKSVTHCKVMMSSRFTDMGVAKVGNFWSQEMASPKPGK